MNNIKNNNNIPNNNNVGKNNNRNKADEDKLEIKIKNLIVRKYWDKSEKSASIIMSQTTLEHALEKDIDNSFIKLQLPITEFKLNDNTFEFYLTNSFQKYIILLFLFSFKKNL